MLEWYTGSNLTRRLTDFLCFFLAETTLQNKVLLVLHEKMIASMYFRLGHTLSWSNCSSEFLRNVSEFNEFQCLNNAPNRSRIFLPECGNEIVEENEQCDCGSKENCTR